MEIQGLSDAPNTQSQHGALPRSASSLCQLEPRLLSARTDSDGPLGPPEPHSDNNNNDAGPKTSLFRLLEENGCSAATVCDTQPAASSSTGAFLGLHNLTADKDSELDSLLVSDDFSRTGWRHEDSGDMTLPLSREEEEPTAERQLAAPPCAIRQQSSVGSRGAAAPRGWRSVSITDKRAPDRYVRFSTLREDGRLCEYGRSEMKAEVPEYYKASPPFPTESSKDSSSIPTESSKDSPFIPTERSKDSHFIPTERSKDSTFIPTERSKDSTFIPTERSKESTFGPGEVVSIPFSSSADSLAFPHTLTSRAQPIFSLITDGSAVIHAKQTNQHTVEDVVLTNKYGDQICGQVCTDTSDGKLLRELSRIDESIALISEMEAVEKSEYSTNSRIQQDGTNSVPAASETFSGTITINNQSIIVTIENGILTLAAPPEGHVHKEDDMVSLKEHLGMKDHEDIVLLNYDGGTKSIGKISTLAVASPSQQEEPRPALSVSDSELTLADDSLSELSASFDSCPIVKQEAGALCTVTEVGLINALPNGTTADCDNEDISSLPLIRSKKDTVASFGCPEPGCSCTFESRQKLKVHLLNHAEDPRPYQCTVEGCGWAFATSYKLKRHLQSHDKQRPHICQFEGCGRRFTTVYNLKAHVKVHEQDDAFTCEICNEKFRSSTRLNNHQRVHFEPQRPHKCEYPGCEKTFITFSALFSHNRTHFRETGHFACTFPGCDKTYDKACRLKIHMRSHTGERPFVCDSEGCGWSFTSMSKLLRHKRKHDDDRRFVCTEEGCGKSFTRAEHLKGHSITHLGTKPFQCHAEGCNAKFSARSSLYIHSKKHKQDGSSLRTRCPVASCSKHFSSRSSLKSHILKHHHLSPDVLSQMESTPTLTPSSELISSTPTSVAGPGVVGGDQLNLDLSSLFSPVPGVTAPTGVGIPVGGSASSGSFTMDLSMVSSGILTIDPSSGGTTLVTSTNTTLAKALDPLIMANSADMVHQHGLEGTVGDVLPPQGTLNLDDVQRVTPEALGTLTALTLQGAAASVDPTLQHPLSSSNSLNVETAASLAVAPAAELLASPSKGVEVTPQGGAGSLLGCVEVMAPQEGGKVLTQFVFPSHSSCFSPQKDPEPAVSPSSFLESGGSARTDYRAIQMAKKRKQRGSSATSCQRNTKASRVAMAIIPPRYGDGAIAGSGGLTLRDPVTGAQYVQIQLLQDDPAGDGDLAFQLSSQPSSSHSQLTVDLPVNILQQEPSMMTEEDNGSDNSQFTGSTINLQDLE